MQNIVDKFISEKNEKGIILELYEKGIILELYEKGLNRKNHRSMYSTLFKNSTVLRRDNK